MTKIKNTNAYPFDVTISDLDYVIGSDGDNLGKITRNYNIGDLRRYINSGLSPEVGGTLKVSEITYNGVLTSPSEVANALDPNYQVLQYHIVIFSVNGNKYILKEQDITLGLSGTAITDEDFILIIGFTKLGDGTNVLKGYNTSTGLHEFYSIKKDGNLLNLTESLGNIVLSIDETELSEFIKENGKTYSVDNVGTGVEVYKDSTVVGDNTQFNFRTVVQENQGTGKSFLRDIQQTTDELKVRVKTLVSDNLTITATDEEVRIETPMTASIPALYVNNLYIPTYQEWLSENSAQNGGTPIVGFVFRGKGTLAQPFTDSIVYPLAGGSATIIPNTAIQNALDGDSAYAFPYSYVGSIALSYSRLNPQRVGQKIKIQDNTSYYNFAGDFGYSQIDLEIGANVTSSTTGYLIDMDNSSHFNILSDRATITIGESYILEISGDGLNNSGTNIATNIEQQSRGIGLQGKGGIVALTNDITKYIINSDILSTGNNNDGSLTFRIECGIYAKYQGILKIGGVSRVWNFGKMQSSDPNAVVDVNLKPYLLLGGDFRSFQGSRLEFSGARNDAFVFTPTGGFIPKMVGQSAAISSLSTITNLFTKTNNNLATLSFTNSDSSVSLLVTNIFESTNLWGVYFNKNIFQTGTIDSTKADLTIGNTVSVTNSIGDNLIENLRIFDDRVDAISAGVPLYSAYLKTSGVAYPTTTGWVRDIVLPA